MVFTFSDYMHAFASLVSMECSGCVFEGEKLHCVVGKETGWPPSKYFQLHLELLKDIETCLPSNAEFKNFVQEQIIVTQDLLSFQNEIDSYLNASGTLSQTEFLKQLENFALKTFYQIFNQLETPGESILYPWGTLNHQVYVDIRHQQKKYQITIFDLGAGRQGNEPVYKPVQFERDRNLLKEKILQLVMNQNEVPSVELYQSIYESSQEECEKCVAEIKQTTGNCVVKNLLAAIQQDAFWKFGEDKGKKIFQCFYLFLIQATLKKVRNHVDKTTPSLPPLTDVCRHITDNQVAFKGVNISDIISDEYENLSKYITIHRKLHKDLEGLLDFSQDITPPFNGLLQFLQIF